MPDRHKRRPRAVRLPGDLDDWCVAYAASTGRPVNAIIVAAVDSARIRIERGTTTKAGDPVPGAARKPAARTEPPAKCAHRFVLKGWCKDCREYVGQRSPARQVKE